MQIFIDSANPEEVKELSSLGIIDGVTTNPNLAYKDKANFKEDIMKILELSSSIGTFPVSIEVLSTEYDQMIKDAKALHKLNANVVVKLPATFDGIKAVKELNGEGIKTNVTLVFSVTQALLAAKAGATYISPFVGRLEDIAVEGNELVESCVQMIQYYVFDTKVLYASVRSVKHIKDAIKYQADAITAPYKVLKEICDHPLTNAGLKTFLDEWRGIGQEYVV